MRKFGLLLVLGNVVWMAACGGGGGGGSTSTITSVSVTCSPTTITSGGTSQCSATVTGTGNFSSAVLWSANNNATISSSGQLTGPPVTMTTTVTVTATSVQDSTKAGTANVTVNPTSGATNVQPITVDAGPEPQTFLSTNLAFVTLTVCVPGSTTQCQTIDHIQVDTGSEGLRLLSGVLNIPLPQSNDSGGDPMDECLIFSDGYVWGPVATADIAIAGEQAQSVPVQIMIPTASNPPAPNSCTNQTSGSNDGDSVEALGANGLVGVGLFQQDCGEFCVNNSSNPNVYYGCQGNTCNPTTATLAQQVTNPVSLFATDNNGVLIQLPSVPDGGSPTVDGSLIFGIGTQSNNGLGSATVYNVDDQGNFTTVFNGTAYSDSFIDSGSNGLFFLDSSVFGVPPTCSDQNSWYCPTTSPDDLTAGNQGTNMNSPVTVNFSIENADTLFNGNNTAFSTLGGPFPNTFDWGLPFFYGRSVFTAIENKSTPGGPGPYFAY